MVGTQEKSGQVDAYVRMTLYDPSTGNTEAFRTTTQACTHEGCHLRM